MAVRCCCISRLRSAANSIDWNSCSSRSSPWRAKGTRFWPHSKLRQNPRRCCSPSKAWAPSWPPSSGREGLCRHFDNRRQVASYAGLAPTPWQSGAIHREQGVSKAGNPRLRTTLIQLARLWLRHQPQSALAIWFKEPMNRNGGRFKKTTIVALARKLLVALWKMM